MKHIIAKTIIFCALLAGCQPSKTSTTIYESPQFKIYNDKVVQGEYEAIAISPKEIISNYQSPANENLSPLIEFKFSINGKDDEFAPGKNHLYLIGDTNPTYTFGDISPEEMGRSIDGKKLSPNTKATIKMDASNVIKSFEQHGYYITPTGDKIFKSDFDGFYIAGSQDPLSWDFDNLKGRQDMKLQPTGEYGIYEITLTLNPYNEGNFVSQKWVLKNDISKFPQYNSDQVLVDALYNLSLDETVLDTEDDDTFRTGKEWSGVWTRDVSYSILLAYAMIEPEIAKNSLLRKVKRDRIIQDTGSGGAWPVSTDRTTWALAAYEVYKSTGDQDWLEKAFQIIDNSIKDDEKTIVDHKTGLRKGESSFLDWRTQEYPIWMTNVDIYNSECLGTNAVHFQTYQILAEMAELLGINNEAYLAQAENIKKGMNEYLWVPSKGYYGMYLYGLEYQSLDPRPEILGEAFTVLFDIADSTQAQQTISNVPMTPYGATCFYPQIPDVFPYHNNGI
ncbi:alpha-L-rhamnosidase-related protein [Aureibacter tunicatorum]|uniref:Alpha-L-rhamnosidase six-hairpin glycosidase domain-containing protein n=1 Tax=Aureibacter tunicatorum TaxID=866807 RepID=A0AAE3XM55_9BACT|nr:hypothetical protein [Aureibacter tunicatorum]MDR6238321.1 hypothetical protein [Aureibacter tunicatorum]BDD03353.1 hypothetical protein AUTU_08360 [Aureibacter tunicatorum]